MAVLLNKKRGRDDLSPSPEPEPQSQSERRTQKRARRDLPASNHDNRSFFLQPQAGPSRRPRATSTTSTVATSDDEPDTPTADTRPPSPEPEHRTTGLASASGANKALVNHLSRQLSRLKTKDNQDTAPAGQGEGEGANNGEGAEEVHDAPTPVPVEDEEDDRARSPTPIADPPTPRARARGMRSRSVSQPLHVRHSENLERSSPPPGAEPSSSQESAVSDASEKNEALSLFHPDSDTSFEEDQ